MNWVNWVNNPLADLAKAGDWEALQQRFSAPDFPGWDEAVSYGAVEGGHLQVLQWLRRNGCPWSAKTSGRAASCGHLAILQWLQAHGCPWDAGIWEDALLGRHAHIVQWLKGCQPPCPLDTWACSWAAAVGDLDTLRWLRTRGCPWTDVTCSQAAYGGHLPVLQWVRAQDPPCPWDEWTCYGAASEGHLQVLQWLRAQDPPCCWDLPEAFSVACYHGQWEVVQWLVQHHDSGLPDALKGKAAKGTMRLCGRSRFAVLQQKPHQQGHYLPCLWLAVRWRWNDPMEHWLSSVTQATKQVLEACLCADLVGLVHQYC